MQEFPAMTQAFLVANLARMSTIHERIKTLRKKQEGLSIERLADTLGVSWQTVQQWENGRSAPSRKRIQSVADALETTVDYLLTGAPPEEREAQYIPDLENHPGAVPIRKVIFKISAGIAGFSVEYLDNGDGEPIFQPQNWFEKRGIDPAKVYAARVSGQSMEPKYSEGDLVVIDTGNIKREKGAVYAFNHDGEFIVKRLEHRFRRWWLCSDNPNQKDFPPEECDESTHILGRIVLHQSESF